MSRRVDEASGAKYFRHMPSRQQAASTDPLPNLMDVAGFVGLVDLLLRRRVYLGIWAGRDGNVIFLDIKDGRDQYRYGCTSEAELRSVVSALYQKYDGS